MIIIIDKKSIINKSKTYSEATFMITSTRKLTREQIKTMLSVLFVGQDYSVNELKSETNSTFRYEVIVGCDSSD